MGECMNSMTHSRNLDIKQSSEVTLTLWPPYTMIDFARARLSLVSLWRKGLTLPEISSL
jgi:hypothetical protein